MSKSVLQSEMIWLQNKSMPLPMTITLLLAWYRELKGYEDSILCTICLCSPLDHGTLQFLKPEDGILGMICISSPINQTQKHLSRWTTLKQDESLSGEKMSIPLSGEMFCTDLRLCQRCKQTASYSAITTSQLIFQLCDNSHHHFRGPTDLRFVLVENDPNFGERGILQLHSKCVLHLLCKRGVGRVRGMDTE
jgi:hypothetical protein